MKNGSCSATTVAGSAALPFGISTGDSWAFGPPKAMKNGPVQQLLLLEAPPSPLSSRPELQRSAVERSAVSGVLSWERFLTEPGQMDVLRIFEWNWSRSRAYPDEETARAPSWRTQCVGQA